MTKRLDLDAKKKEIDAQVRKLGWISPSHAYELLDYARALEFERDEKFRTAFDREGKPVVR